MAVKPWKADDSLEWTYERDEGDIVVFARTAKEALDTIKEHGFTNLKPQRLKATGRRLTDELKKEGIQ